MITGSQNYVTMRKPAEPDDEAVIFTAELKSGPVALHTWFDDESGQAITGAYYVYVKKK